MELRQQVSVGGMHALVAATKECNSRALERHEGCGVLLLIRHIPSGIYVSLLIRSRRGCLQKKLRWERSIQHLFGLCMCVCARVRACVCRP